MQILLIEPFFSGSHQQWAQGYRRHSQHQIELLSLPGRHWKWRMYGGAVSLARQFLSSGLKPDLLLVSDMLDLSTFLGLTRDKTAGIPVALYCHENQITYPWSPTDRDPQLERNNQYGFINYTSALAADRVFFNSRYHLESFLSALPAFLQQFPDHRESLSVEHIRAKSDVLPLGLDLRSLEVAPALPPPNVPVLLWNHRWEYDKNPELFFESLLHIKSHGINFKLIVLGEAFRRSPPIFQTIKKTLADQLIQFGYAPDRKNYAQWLQLADIIPVTSRQDFFGLSAVEAIYAGCYPLLPDRLAFPEHIPPSHRSKHLYPDEQAFLSRLLEVLPEFRTIRENTGYRDFVAHYDWRILAADYDRKMESLV